MLAKQGKKPEMLHMENTCDLQEIGQIKGLKTKGEREKMRKKSLNKKKMGMFVKGTSDNSRIILREPPAKADHMKLHIEECMRYILDKHDDNSSVKCDNSEELHTGRQTSKKMKTVNSSICSSDSEDSLPDSPNIPEIAARLINNLKPQTWFEGRSYKQELKKHLGNFVKKNEAGISTPKVQKPPSKSGSSSIPMRGCQSSATVRRSKCTPSEPHHADPAPSIDQQDMITEASIPPISLEALADAKTLLEFNDKARQLCEAQRQWTVTSQGSTLHGKEITNQTAITQNHSVKSFPQHNSVMHSRHISTSSETQTFGDRYNVLEAKACSILDEASTYCRDSICPMEVDLPSTREASKSFRPSLLETLLHQPPRDPKMQRMKQSPESMDILDYIDHKTVVGSHQAYAAMEAVQSNCTASPALWQSPSSHSKTPSPQWHSMLQPLPKVPSWVTPSPPQLQGRRMF